MPAPLPPRASPEMAGAAGTAAGSRRRSSPWGAAPAGCPDLNVAIRDAQAVAEIYGHHELLEQHPGLRLRDAPALRPAPKPAYLPVTAPLAVASLQKGLRPSEEDWMRQRCSATQRALLRRGATSRTGIVGRSQPPPHPNRSIASHPVQPATL